MSSQGKEDKILQSLFGDESLANKFQNMKDPKEKIGMIWKTAFFQVRIIAGEKHLVILKNYLL